MNEENGHEFPIDENEVEPGFEVLSLIDNEKKTAIDFISCRREWYRRCGIEIEQRNRLEIAFEKKSELGLFGLFLNKTFFEFVQKWTTEKMRLRGLLGRTNVLTMEKLYAYLGLEVAMLLCKFNHISDYWCGKPFLGNQEFKKNYEQKRLSTY